MSRTEPQTTSAQASVITPELAREARARAWAFAFERWREKQEAARTGGPDDAKKESTKHVRARTIIPD
jgi:hypothetical protein